MQNAIKAVLLVGALLSFAPKSNAAVPIIPCISVASSSDGNSIVFAKTDRARRESSFTVFTKDGRLNWGDFTRLPGEHTGLPAKYWGSWGMAPWTVTIQAGSPADTAFDTFGDCPMPLITDDGKFLILLATDDGHFNDRPVLRVYHEGKSGQTNILIKDIFLKDLWPGNQIPAKIAYTDYDWLEWFDGGTFTFSEDNHHLVHHTRWGNTVDINLQDGTVARK